MKVTHFCIYFFCAAFSLESTPPDFSEKQIFKQTAGKKTMYKGAVRHGPPQDLPAEWNWGIRTGMSYNTVVENWTVSATHTRFHTRMFATTQMPTGLLLPTWKEGDKGGFASAWRLHLDLADIEVGKSFEARERIMLRPHAGIRGAWICQKSKLQPIQNLGQSPAKPKVPFFANNCLGVGLRSGLDSSLEIGKGFAVFGDGALSLLAGYYNIDQKKRPIQRDSHMLDEENRASGGIMSTELALGLSYRKSFFEHALITVSLGYEMNYIFNQTRWMNWFSNAKGIGSDAGSGMALQGGSFSLKFCF